MKKESSALKIKKLLHLVNPNPIVDKYLGEVMSGLAKKTPYSILKKTIKENMDSELKEIGVSDMVRKDIIEFMYESLKDEFGYSRKSV